MDPNYRPTPNVSKRIRIVLEESAKLDVHSPQPTDDIEGQRLGKLFEVGTNSLLVVENLRRRHDIESLNSKSSQQYQSLPEVAYNMIRKPNDERTIYDMTSSSQNKITPKRHSPDVSKHMSSGQILKCGLHSEADDYYSKHLLPENTPSMRIDFTISCQDKLPFGKYHITQKTHPYKEKFQVSMNKFLLFV